MSNGANGQWKIAGAQGDYLFNIMRIDSTLFIGANEVIYISKDSNVNNWLKLYLDITQAQRFYRYGEKVLVVANSGLYETEKPFSNWRMLNNELLRLIVF